MFPAIKTILYATDFSERSRPALDLAASLARDLQARLIVLHVVVPPTAIYGEGAIATLPLTDLEDARRQLLEVRPTDPSVPVEHRLVEGDPAEEIAREARDGSCDLIVLGTHGRSGLPRLLLGSVAEQVLRRTHCPVLTARVPFAGGDFPMKPIQTILHPTDFSPRSQQAFEMACSLARDRGARLIVLHVLPRPLIVPAGVMMSPPPEPPVEERREVMKRLQSVQPNDPAVRVEHLLEQGDAVAGILAIAREQCCDLIVLGTHGRTGLERLLMGSVAEHVLRQAPCPVLAVKSDPPAVVEGPAALTIGEALILS